MMDKINNVGHELIIKIDMSCREDAHLKEDMRFYNEKEEEIVIPKTTKLFLVSDQYYFRLNGSTYRMFYNEHSPWEADLSAGHYTIYNTETEEYYYSYDAGPFEDYFDGIFPKNINYEKWWAEEVEKLRKEIEEEKNLSNLKCEVTIKEYAIERREELDDEISDMPF